MIEETRVVKMNGYVSATRMMPGESIRPAIVQADCTDQHTGEWFLNRALVPEKWRNQGVGSALLQMVLEAAAEMGCKKMIVTPGGYEGKTEKQYRFYAKNGFRPIDLPGQPADLKPLERALAWTPRGKCRGCHQPVVISEDGTVEYHDWPPMCRQICDGSLQPPEAP